MVIAVRVGDVDGGQVLATGNDPFCQVGSGLEGELGVDEDCVFVAVDERGACGDPFEVVGTGGSGAG